MADSLLVGVISKIGNALKIQATQILRSQISHEFSVVFEVQTRVKQIQTELEIMLAFLKQTLNKKIRNETLEVYFKNVRKLAFEIEDVMDEFIYFFEQHQNENETLSLVKSIFNRSKYVSCWYKIASDLKQIQERLKHLQSLKTRYNVLFPGEENDETNIDERRNNMKEFNYKFDEIKPIGIEEETQKLVQILTSERKCNSIFSIWGMGGSGKTILARNIFERQIIKEFFEIRVWITVSRKYKLENIVMKIARDLMQLSNKESSLDKLDSLNLNELVEIIRKNLKETRYLIVLDDLWSVNLWYYLNEIFKENSHGNCLLITTRLKDVALLASEKCIFPIKGLNDVESWKLFSKYAFKNMYNEGSFPQELENCTRKTVEKCHGLPLAIVVMGNILSFKAPNENEWKEFCNEFYNESSNNGLSLVFKVLNRSFKHLSNQLKNCFLYCSIFPQNYLIHRKRLIRLWIGEGLIEPRSEQSLEEIGEECINELINQCLFQVVERNEFGRVKCIKMHGLLWELAIFISQKEKFSMQYTKSHVDKIDYEVRRLSICEYSDELNSSINLTHVRSFFLFNSINSSMNCIMWVSRNARYLRVLDFQDAAIEYLPTEIMYLFNLHYLGLRNTKIKTLPSSIDKLCNLQTLDLYQTEIEKLPNGIMKLIKLRHLFIGKVIPLYNEMYTIKNIEAPKGLHNLINLQTLKCIQSSNNLVENLGNLTKLRTLSLRDITSTHFTPLFKSIEKMHFLSKLALCATNESQIINFDSLKSPPKNLRKLKLDGKLPEQVLQSVTMKIIGEKLESITLGFSGLKHDPIPSLSYMSNLTSLCLHTTFSGDSIYFQNGWFPKLKRLCIHDLPLVKQIIFEQLAIRNLERLRLFGLVELDELPQGIEFLNSLKEIYLGKLNPGFVNNFERAKEKLKHVPIVKHASKNGGTWIVTNIFQTS